MSEYAHKYRKLGGWLLVFIIFAFLAALSTVVDLLFSRTGFLRSFSAYEGAMFWLQLLIQMCLLYEAALRVTYAVMLFRRDQRFARTWQLMFIGQFIRPLAQLVIHLRYGFPERAASAYNTAFAIGLTNDIFAFLPGLLLLFLLTLYLRKSVRVRTYMGSDEYLRLAVFTRKATPIPAVPDENNAGTRVSG